jgi:hypothetical protein
MYNRRKAISDQASIQRKRLSILSDFITCNFNGIPNKNKSNHSKKEELESMFNYLLIFLLFGQVISQNKSHD